MQICTQECYVCAHLNHLFLSEDMYMHLADASIAKTKTPQKPKSIILF